MAALYQAGRPITGIARACNVSAESVRRHARAQQWQRLTDDMTKGKAPVSRDQQQLSPDAGLAVLAHKQAVRDLRERLAGLCAEPGLGSTASGSLSKAALELSRALTVAVTLERRLLGLEDAGGDQRGPGVVIVMPAMAAPRDWDRAASAQRRANSPRRRAMVTIHEGPPPETADDDDSPDLDAED